MSDDSISVDLTLKVALEEVYQDIANVIKLSKDNPDALIKKYPPFIPNTSIFMSNWESEGVKVKFPKDSLEKLESLGLKEVFFKIYALTKQAEKNNNVTPEIENLIPRLFRAAAIIDLNIANQKEKYAKQAVYVHSGMLHSLMQLFNALAIQNLKEPIEEKPEVKSGISLKS